MTANKRTPKRPVSKGVKDAADRAEARAKGKPVAKPKVPIDPVIVPAAILAKEKKRASPVFYSKEIAATICARVSERETLKEICADPAMPARSAAYAWLSEHAEFKDMYARAREERADLLADEIVAIADAAEDANKARLQIDARKWWAAKVNPKKYGDRQGVTLDATHMHHMTTEPPSDLETARRIAYLLGRAVGKAPVEA